MDFINSYISRLEKGELVTIHDRQEDFEKLDGKKVHKTTIYRLLKRHGWEN